MLVKDGLLAKLFAALHTHIRLLTSMYPEVLVEDGALAKRLAAEGAVVWLVTRVNADVLLQVRGLAEQFATLWTHVGPVCAVCPLVLHQPTLQLEPLATQIALKRFVLLVVRVLCGATVHRRVGHRDHGGQTRGMSPVLAWPSSALV